jgi:hypothetical protein
MTGMYTLEAGHDILRRQNLLSTDGLNISFMEQADFHIMEPTDTLASDSTKWVLANPGESYIAYTYDCSGPMGITNMITGVYDLRWFDTLDGNAVRQSNVSVSPGDATWLKPISTGTEIELYIHRSAHRR